MSRGCEPNTSVSAPCACCKSPSGDSLPPELGQFDFIMFNAVFEHLLPHERPKLLPLVWQHLRPGGVLFLNQTPYRYSLVEVHTTGGMPFINYLPDSVTLWAARKFCKRVQPNETWNSLLRRGIRGGTVPEILGILGGSKHARLLTPSPPVRRPHRPVVQHAVDTPRVAQALHLVLAQVDQVAHRQADHAHAVAGHPENGLSQHVNPSGARTAATMPPHAPVAQLDRALGFEPSGRRFESVRARQLPR